MGLLEDLNEYVPPDFKLIIRDTKNIICLDVHRHVLIASSSFFREHLCGKHYYSMTVGVSSISLTREIISWMYLRDKCKLVETKKMVELVHFFGVSPVLVPKSYPNRRHRPQTRSTRMRLRSGNLLSVK